jgi:ribosomal protein S18 acetylase RimI-like enzyme
MPKMADLAWDVRPIRPGDSGWEAHVGLFADYRVHYGQAHEPDRCDLWLREQFNAGRYRCYLARSSSDGRAAGMANVVVTPASMVLSLYWQLRDVYVAQDRRQAGVGRALVDTVVAEARAAGAARVTLQTEVGNDGAVSLYRSAGFAVVDELTLLNLPLSASRADSDGT